MANELTDLLNYDITLLEDVTTPIYVEGLNLTTLESIKKYLYDTSYNVKDFGAKGDDTTDDTEVIKTVIALSKKNKKNIYFPAGVYKISDTLNLHSNVIVFGDGASSCIKMYNDGCEINNLPSGNAVYQYIKYIFNIVSETNEDMHDITIRDLRLDGNAADSFKQNPHYQKGAYHGIYLQTTDKYTTYNITVKDCIFENCWNCGISSSRYSYVIPKSIYNILVEGCRFKTIGYHGIGMNYWKDSVATNNVCEECGRIVLISNNGTLTGGGLGIDVSGGCENIIISNNIIKGSPGAMKAQSRNLDPDPNGVVNFLPTRNISFIGNKCYDLEVDDENLTIFYCISVQGTECKCIDNYFGRTSGRGVFLGEYSYECVISNNIFEPQNFAAIEVRAYQGTEIGNHIISNNILRGGNDNGILVISGNNIIENNNISNFALSGISVRKGNNNIIRGNIIYDNSSVGIYINPVNNDPSLCNNNIIDSNICFNSNETKQLRGISILPETTDNHVKLSNNVLFGHTNDIYPVKTRHFNSDWFKREILCEYYLGDYSHFKILTNLSSTVFNIELTFNYYNGSVAPQRMLINGYATTDSFSAVTYTMLNNEMESEMPTVILSMESGSMVLYIETVKKNTSVFVKLIPVGYTSSLAKNNNTYILGYTNTNDVISNSTQVTITPPKHKGDTATRNSITPKYIGYQFFDTTENKMYYWNNGWK